MLRRKWIALLAAAASGATLLQTTACAETAQIVTGVSTALSAGGLLFIIRRIIET